MKAFITAVLLILIIGNIGAVDIDSFQFIDYLRAKTAPGKPEIYENSAVFTAPSAFQRVGISFAHEGYSRVHWFRRLMIPANMAELAATAKKPKNIDPNKDSGIMFHVESIPAGVKNMDYRLIVDGLWMADPLNPLTVAGPSGVVESRLPLPANSRLEAAAGMQGGTYRFSYRTVPGETITVAGTFNNWDPFMYEMREVSPGYYTLTLVLAPGKFQYLFFHRGEGVPDPANLNRFYTRDGRIISEAQPAPHE